MTPNPLAVKLDTYQTKGKIMNNTKHLDTLAYAVTNDYSSLATGSMSDFGQWFGVVRPRDLRRMLEEDYSLEDDEVLAAREIMRGGLTFCVTVNADGGVFAYNLVGDSMAAAVEWFGKLCDDFTSYKVLTAAI